MSPRCAVLSDAQWKQIAPLMPESAGKLGRSFKDHRLMTEGSSTGIGPASRGGTWDKALASLLTRADAAGLINWEVSVDSTVNRAHQHGTNLSRGRGSS